MDSSEDFAHLETRKRTSRLPSIPLLGGNVHHTESHPQKTTGGKQFRQAIHQQSPRSQIDDPPIQKRQRATVAWQRRKDSSTTALKRAKRKWSFQATSQKPKPRRRPHKRVSLILRVSYKLTQTFEQQSQQLRHKCEDVRFAIESSTKLAGAIARAETFRDKLKKSVRSQGKEFEARISRFASKIERKALEKTGIELELEKKGQRRGNGGKRVERESEGAQGLEQRRIDAESAGKRIREKISRGPGNGRRLWGPRALPVKGKKR